MSLLKEKLKKMVVVNLIVCLMHVLCSLNAKSNNDKRLPLSGKQLVLLLVWVEELSDIAQGDPFP